MGRSEKELHNLLLSIVGSAAHIALCCIGRESNPGQLLGKQLCYPLYHQRIQGTVQMFECSVAIYMGDVELWHLSVILPEA